MAWRLDGTYFENCSCEAPCPCTVSFDLGADYDRCLVLLAFHVDSGEIDGVDVGDTTVAVVADAPKVMTDGNWRVGLVIDEGASDEQAEKLGGVFGGQMGGPMGAVAELIGEIAGIERARIDFSEDGLDHEVRIGDAVDIAVRDVVPVGSPTGEPAQVTRVAHPAGSTLTIGKATRSRVSLLGFDFANREGTSAFSAPFSWTG